MKNKDFSLLPGSVAQAIPLLAGERVRDKKTSSFQPKIPIRNICLQFKAS